MATFEELRDEVMRKPPECAKLTPFELTEANEEQGLVKVTFAPQPAFGNHFGNIQGGFAAAMLDLPISVAVYVKLKQWLPTLELKCSFLRPAKIGTCVAEGRVLRAGQSIVFVEGRLWGADGELAVHATATVGGALKPRTG